MDYLLRTLKEILENRPVLLGAAGCVVFSCILLIYAPSSSHPIQIGGTVFDLKLLAFPSSLLLFLVGLGIFLFIQRGDFSFLPKQWKPSLQPGQYIANHRCGVFHSIDPGEYSLVTAEYVKRDHVKQIFTLAVIEPRFFIAEILKYAQPDEPDVDNLSLEQLIALGNSKFQELADAVFPHFAEFRRFNAANRGNIARVLLMTDNGWLNRNRSVLGLFKWLNGSVDCRVSRSRDLQAEGNDIHFLTDYVSFNQELFVDYYDESQTLIMSIDSKGPVKKEIAKLEANFYRKKGTALYQPLDQFIAQHAG
jgi:hypothetical protein